MNLDPTTALAMSLHANPGVYALLIGSGVSRAASIPTGWGVTLDLIERLAAAQGETTAGDPASWFQRKYGTDADYSNLLEQLYDQGSRQAKLREYFEPSAAERDEGRKLPTKAHRAIARLVRDGYIRVIVTTNFDHLLEDAIRAEGVEPTVISTPDAVEGAVPLVHARCVILKVHGDYLDARIKNTKEELAAYDPRLDRLLDQVLEGFGLVVCGWSGDWDPALRAAIDRCANRRYTTFWTDLKEPAGAGQALITRRQAKFIKVNSAEDFFESLAEKVTAISEAAGANPAETAVVVAMAKRYLPEERHRVRLHDLLVGEARAVRQRLLAIESPFHGGSFNFEQEVGRREQAADTLLHVLSASGLHARHDQPKLLRRCVEVLAAPLLEDNESRGIHSLLLYPAALAIYVCALAGLADGNDAVAAEMIRARGGIGVERGRLLPLFANTGFGGHTQRPPDKQRLLAPASEFFHSRCREWVGPLYPDADVYDLALDRFEYVTALAARDDEDESGGRFEYGRWMWRASWGDMRGLPDVRKTMAAEIEREGEGWPYLRAGLFGASLARLNQVKQAFDQDLEQTIQRMRHGLS